MTRRGRNLWRRIGAHLPAITFALAVVATITTFVWVVLWTLGWL